MFQPGILSTLPSTPLSIDVHTHTLFAPTRSTPNTTPVSPSIHLRRLVYHDIRNISRGPTPITSSFPFSIRSSSAPATLHDLEAACMGAAQEAAGR